MVDFMKTIEGANDDKMLAKTKHKKEMVCDINWRQDFKRFSLAV